MTRSSSDPSSLGHRSVTLLESCRKRDKKQQRTSGHSSLSATAALHLLQVCKALKHHAPRMCAATDSIRIPRSAAPNSHDETSEDDRSGEDDEDSY